VFILRGRKLGDGNWGTKTGGDENWGAASCAGPPAVRLQGITLLDEHPTTSTSWIDSCDRRTGGLIWRHEATDDEVRDLAAGRAVPAATPADGPERAPAGRTDADEFTTWTYDDGPQPPRFSTGPVNARSRSAR
jgi:hypothetical protein